MTTTRPGISHTLQLIVLSSASGAGKTTLWHMLIEDPAMAGFHVSVSHTTRKPRPGERDGIDYHFVSEATFEAMIASDGFLEHARVHGNLYGTSTSEVERIASLPGARGIVFDIDVQGARQIARHHRGALTVFVLPPDVETLRRRLASRGTESSAELDVRMRNAIDEIRQYESFSHIVVNDDLQTAYREFVTVIEAHRLSTSMRRSLAEALLADRKRETVR